MKIFKLFCLIPLLYSFSNASNLKNIVRDTIENNPKIKAIESNSKANKYYIDESFGDYLPTLSYEAYIEDKKSLIKPLNGTATNESVSGSNQQLKLEQIIYNGGLTPAKVEEAKHNYQATLLLNIYDTEKVILDVILSYLDYVKYEELRKLTLNNLEIQETYLETAIQTEEVSGDIVDRLLVESKILTAKEKLLDLQNDSNNAKVLIEKSLSKKLDDRVCRPMINENIFSDSLENILNIGIKNNYKVLQEIEKIKAQNAVVSQETSRFLPTLKFHLLKEIDDGIDTENSRKNHESARLTLSYNLFNGLKDKAIYDKESLFLSEAQKNLDNVSDETKQKIVSEYNKFTLSSEKISILKEHVLKNKEILKVFEEQFDGGTRSFIDVLNQEEDLYRKKSDLIEEEFKKYNSYYTLLLELSKLSDTIMNSNSNMCKKDLDVDYRVIEKKKDIISSELESLLSSDNNISEIDVEEKNYDNNEKIKEKVNKVFSNLLNDIYNTDSVERIDINSNNIEESYKFKEDIKKDEIKIEDKIEDKNKVEEEILSSETITLEDELKKESSDKFTIVLSTVAKPNVTSNSLENSYNLDNVFAYNFINNNKKYIKVIYGLFNTSNEAREALKLLDKSILKDSPFVDNISKHQRLYKNNNSVLGEEN